MARQKCTTAFSTGISCNEMGKRAGSGSKPTQSKLVFRREAATNFSRKFIALLLYLKSNSPCARFDDWHAFCAERAGTGRIGSGGYGEKGIAGNGELACSLST